MLPFLLIVSRIAYAELVVFGEVKVGSYAIVVFGSAVATCHHTGVDVMLLSVVKCVDSCLVVRMERFPMGKRVISIDRDYAFVECQ